jgi:hypothetical protein
MPPMCVIFGTVTRVTRRMSPLTVSAPGAHTWSRRVNRRNTKGFFHTTVGKSRQIRHSHKRRRFRTKPPYWIVIGRARKAPLSVEAERALEGIVPGWNARFNWRDGGACCSARVGYWTPRDNASYRHCQGVGWLWLGLASGTRSLESVARGMGPGALRPQPPLRHLAPQRQLARSLRQLGTAIRRVATLPQLARPKLRLARHRCAAHNPDRSACSPWRLGRASFSRCSSRYQCDRHCR